MTVDVLRCYQHCKQTNPQHYFPESPPPACFVAFEGNAVKNHKKYLFSSQVQNPILRKLISFNRKTNRTFMNNCIADLRALHKPLTVWGHSVRTASACAVYLIRRKRRSLVLYLDLSGSNVVSRSRCQQTIFFN